MNADARQRVAGRTPRRPMQNSKRETEQDEAQTRT
ncbi:hypothetical protein BPC006_I3113 [Burkholderia pseudomallei BPC006]|nr:hypothetical protein BPC006_I3113 [Burkholderia pseudomallei BPC006]